MNVELQLLTSRFLITLVRYPYAGQTVGEVRWRRSSDSKEFSTQRVLRRILDAWWGERRRVLPKQLTTPFRVPTRRTVWGHFSQLCVWRLRAVGCGAVRHSGARLLLVCDFSHTNMLGQPTFSPGPLAQCPVHTARRSASPYPLLCAPIRYPDHDDVHNNLLISDYKDDDDEDDEVESEFDETTMHHVSTVTEFPVSALAAKFDSTVFLSNRNPKILMNYQDGRINEVTFKTQKYRSSTRHYVEEDDHGRTYSVNWRMNKEHASKISTSRKYRVSDRVYSREKLKNSYRPVHSTQEIQITRHHWKQTRNRPRRPGANALLLTSTRKQLHRSTVVMLNFDKDDVEQLYRDTGFNINWRKQQKSSTK